MIALPEYRAKTQLSAAAIAEREGKLLTQDDVQVLIQGACRWFAPDGKLLLVYLPGAVTAEIEAVYEILHELKKYETNNRGMASGTPREPHGARGTRSYAASVASAIVGNFEASGNYKYCRLTAFSRDNLEKWQELHPLLQAVAAHMAEYVPDRYANQMRAVAKTRPEWTIPGTPFTTITVNNTYPTGVHTDKGDLDEGFSTLTVLRRGEFTGGNLCFPEYGLNVNMQTGDLLLMDAHRFHGNLPLKLISDDAERISVVSYFRTRMVLCDAPEAEAAKALERGNTLAERLIDETDLESARR